jgi:hypothetical protein
MSEFSSDLNAEKIDEIRSSVDSLKDQISQMEGDFGDIQFAVDRLETLEFFDRGDDKRQTIVHWLDEVEPDEIETIEDAKKAFVEFSEERRGQNKEHQVGHGDILVIGGECPYYAVCAKVDRGVGGGDAGFQEEDKLDVAGTEEENEKAYKEFIVWGGCGNEGVVGDPCAGQGGATASAVGSVSTYTHYSSKGPQKIGILGTQESEASEISTIISSLEELSLKAKKEESTPKEFIGLQYDSSCYSSDSTCKGIFMNVVSINSTPVKLSLCATVNNEALDFKPVDVVDKEITVTSSSTSITATSTKIASTACGDVSNQDDEGGDSDRTLPTASWVEDTSVADETPTTLHQVSKEEMENSLVEGSVSLGGSLNVSTFSNDDFDADEKVFLPVVSACPQTGSVPVFSEFWSAGTSAEVTRACGADSSLDTQQITVTLTPKINTLNFECGLLVGTTEAETMGNAQSIQFTMEIPCGTEQTFGCEEIEICDDDSSQPRTIVIPKYVDASGADLSNCPTSESGGSE